MSVEFWLTICATFVGIGLSLLTYITKKEKTGAKISIIVSFIIAIIAFVMGVSNNYKENIKNENTNEININQQENKGNTENTYTNKENQKMFTNYFETHETETNQVSFLLKKWNPYEDKDIKALTHNNENGIKLLAKATFMVEQEDAISDIHLTYNSQYTGDTIMKGKIVTMNETSSSRSCATVSILKDGVEIWKSNKTIQGQTVEPIEFEVDTNGCKNEIVIRFNYYMQKDGLYIGIFE